MYGGKLCVCKSLESMSVLETWKHGALWLPALCDSIIQLFLKPFLGYLMWYTDLYALNLTVVNINFVLSDSVSISACRIPLPRGGTTTTSRAGLWNFNQLHSGIIICWHCKFHGHVKGRFDWNSTVLHVMLSCLLWPLPLCRYSCWGGGL